MIHWDELQKWINRNGYDLRRTGTNHFLLSFPNGNSVQLGPHNSQDGVNNSVLNRIAAALGITRDQLIEQINNC